MNWGPTCEDAADALNSVAMSDEVVRAERGRLWLD